MFEKIKEFIIKIKDILFKVLDFIKLQIQKIGAWFKGLLHFKDDILSDVDKLIYDD